MSLLHNNKYPSFPFEILSNEYGSYCIPDYYKEKVIPKVLAKGQVYEPKTLDFLCKNLCNHDIVTGGSFIGDFFPALSNALHVESRIWSFEPNPLSFEAALYTVSLNNLTNVNLFNVAVGYKNRSAKLKIFDHKNQLPSAAASRIVKSSAGEGCLEVEMTTLDQLVPENREVSILHLDIEGFELHAIKGAYRLIKKNKPIIVLEAPKKTCQSQKYLESLQALFPEHKYSLAGHLEANSIYTPIDINLK